MYPAYPYSYPHHTNSMPYAPNDDPRAKEITPHMKMDPSTMISPYQQPWPYPVPHEYHGCCNHGYYAGGPYSYRPPYPHYPPPPPPFYSQGFYPPFPGYHIPPPHYSVEQPRYDYDKRSHDGHRCSSCNRVEDEKKPRIVQEEPEVDKKTNESLVPLLLKDCPYPIMWVPPGYMKTEPKATEKENETREHHEPVKQGGNGEIDQNQKDGDGYNRFPYQIFWLPSKNKDMENNTKENNVNLVAETESDTSGKHGVQKVIPVKQLHTNEGQKSSKAVQTKMKSDSVKNTDNDIKGTAFSTKTSKLPPVCLRIDPLPGKKKSSRSPSPPADKQRSKGPTLDHPKTSQHQIELSEGLKEKDEQSKSNIKNIQVTHDVNKVEDHLGDPCEVIARKVEKKLLSEHEAALMIQSAYRGFEVRKSQPLTKLRQINGVRKQVGELRNRVQDLESSSSTIHIDDKQKLIIGETIMSLLLKLDTIQGLHPVVRDIRKSVAKELVGLQEKLDSLTLVKTETPSTEKVTHLEEDAIQDMSDREHAQSDSNVKLVDSDLDICENHEVKATEESQDNATADKLDQPHAQSVDCNTETVESDTCGVESREAEDTSAVDGTYDVKPEKVGEQEDTKELNINQHEMSVESALPLDDAIQEKHEACADLTSNQQDTVDNGIQGNSDRAESDTNVEFAESDDSCADVHDVNGESESQHNPLELTSNQIEMSNKEQPTEEEKFDQKQAESESNVDDVESCEHPKVESKEFQNDVNVKTHDVDPPKTVVDVDSPIFNATNEVQEDFIVSTEEAPKADDADSSTEVLIEDLGGVPPLSPTGSRGDDKKLVEENERLRVAVEELMKAGNQQLDVIKELTGRVKDLEKKLSKKKKVKPNKGRCRGSVVKDELRSCLV